MSYFYDQLEESKKRDDKAHKRYDEDEAPYEAEDVGCSCNDDGIESEWEWDKSQQAYVCNGCGEMQ